jgi:predicted ATPase
MTVQKIVFTGGTYAGKTTLVSKLQELGYAVVPEAGEQIISQLNKELGIDGQRKWRSNNPLAFYELIIKRQQELEAQFKLADEAVFHDRGIPDYLGMLKLNETEVPKRLWEAARLHQYHCAFVCETLSSFDNRAATGRSLDRAASLKLQSLCLEIYKELNCPTIILKESPIDVRMQLIKASL